MRVDIAARLPDTGQINCERKVWDQLMRRDTVQSWPKESSGGQKFQRGDALRNAGPNGVES